MGVDLGEMGVGRELDLATLKGKTVALDAANVLYQFLASIRGPDGTPLKDSAGRVTSHLSGILYRTVNLLEAGVRPVFVFDGKPHELKFATLDARRDVKVKAEAAWKEAVAAGDLATARSKAAQTSRLSREMVDRCADLLRSLGIPTIRAPMEGEAQASWMCAQGHVYSVGSQDFDCLLFGAPRLVRNLTLTGRRKLPKKQVWVDVRPEEILLEEVLAATGLSRKQLVDVALLIGTDYNPGVKGIGPKTALKFIQEHGTVEGVYEALEAGKIDPASGNGRRLAEGRVGLGEIDTIRLLFLDHPHTEDFDLAPPRMDRQEAVRILCDEHQFARDRVNGALDRYEALKAQTKQKGLGEFF